MHPIGQAAADRQLPELRPDLQVAHADEHSGYVVFDPVRQTYFRIDQTAARLLSIWPRHRTVAELNSAAATALEQPVSQHQVDELCTFLVANQLATLREPRAWWRLAAIEKRQRGTWLSWLVHNYLFVKIPLINPQPALQRWVGSLEFLFSRSTAIFVAAVGLTGLYFVTRQWGEFWSTFSDFSTSSGLITFVVAMAIVKSLHELGHALTAARHGCRVPSMGICFMVLVPMLYTDVSDAWRLPSRRKRLGIDAAGLVVELVIGCFALFLWAFLPPGGAKSLAFALATTSLMMSLMMNLNPFMRFDGYYILADALGIENLQSRAFDIGVWRMREILFDLRLPPPESMSRRYLATLSIYAWAVWIYRLILFTAIAILVYGIGYKLLGVFLFVTEIVFFIARPIINEIKVWFTIREQIMKRRRGLWVAGTAAVAFALAFLPLSTRIAVPALLDDRDSLQIHPKRAAMVAMVHATPGQWLIAGEKLVSLVAPELDHELLQTEWRFEVATWRLQRRAASASERAETMVLEGTLESLQERLTGLRQERAELDVMMPFAGRVAEMGDALHSGRWLSPRDLIAAVVGNSGCRLVGYVDEDKVGRLEPSGSARFIPEDGRRGAIAATLQTIAAAGSDSLDLPELVSHYGGGVSARVVSRGAEGRSLVPIVGQFRVEARINDPAVCAGGRVERGTLHLVGRAESTIAGVWRQVLKVLVRESSL